MAEARAEEEEDGLRRRDGGRDQVVRRQPNSSGGRPDRRKPEHRHSQGPLSSIRAVIKRTTRPISVAETPRDQERDRDRDRDRDRRRPQITILSAEPLPSTSWFPGAAAGIPPPPPPPAQIWGPTIHPSIQPPPSYEEVIREKTQEQVLPPPSSSSSPSPPSSTRPVCRTTIATQTDPGSDPDPQETPVLRPGRPPRPPFPSPPKSSDAADVTKTDSQSAVPSCEGVAPNSRPQVKTQRSTQCCDLLTDPGSPSTSSCGAQTHLWRRSSPAAAPSERPRPRPRTKLGRKPIGDEVKVQTLVKLREDGLATLAARASVDAAAQEASQGKYLQELLEAFSSDDWGLPDRRSDSSEGSQSQSEEDEEEEGEDMATLRARIQAFEQHGGCGHDNNGPAGTAEGSVAAKRPEPRPRPRLQGQPAKSVPPAIAPKPKNISPTPKPSCKEFWEGEDLSAEPANTETTEALSAEPNPAEPNPAEPNSAEPNPPEPNPAAQTAAEPGDSCTTKSAPQPCRTTEKPPITPKPQPVAETPSSSTPVPAPRPPPPKATPSPPNLRPPPRPAVAPRASLGAPHQDRVSVEVGGGAEPNAAAQSVKVGSFHSSVPTKPAAPTSSRRSSAPNLAPKPTVVPPARPDLNPVLARSPSVPSAAAPKPSIPAKPPTPTPALRKGSVTQTTNPPNPQSSDGPPPPARPSSAKLLPLRPPPIKSAPNRPPPPVIDSTPAANQIAASKAAPAVSAPSSQTAATTNRTQKVVRKGPPLPPRPKPGHPLFSSYMKQDVLIVLDDPTPSPSDEGKDQTPTLINPSQALLDLDPQPDLLQDQGFQSKPALEGQSNHQSILSVQPAEQKEQPDPPVSGPRCTALFDYEGEEQDELTFSQGDVIALLELVDEEWGRGRIHKRVGMFPLKFTEVAEPLPSGGTTNAAGTESSAAPKPPDSQEWVVALFDFPGQTAEDLSFHKGALVQVLEHVDAEWRRGRLEGREGLYPAAFTQPCQTQPITERHAAVKGTARALFDFTAENQDELALKVGDIITQVESVDEQWILGVVGSRRGIVPKNYISFL